MAKNCITEVINSAGGYSKDGNTSLLFKEAVIELSNRLKPEVVSLVDAIAPPDFILNSVLGYADGEVSYRTFLIRNLKK